MISDYIMEPYVVSGLSNKKYPVSELFCVLQRLPRDLRDHVAS